MGSPAAKVSGKVAVFASLLGLTVSGRIQAIVTLPWVLAAAYGRVVSAEAQAHATRIAADAEAHATKVAADAEAHATKVAADAEAHATKVAADAEAHATKVAADAEAHAKRVAAGAKAKETNTRSDCLSVITQDFVAEGSYGGHLIIKEQGSEMNLDRAHSSRAQECETPRAIAVQGHRLNRWRPATDRHAAFAISRGRPGFARACGF